MVESKKKKKKKKSIKIEDFLIWEEIIVNLN